MSTKDLIGMGIIGLSVFLTLTVRGCQTARANRPACHDTIETVEQGNPVNCDNGAESRVALTWSAGGDKAIITVQCTCP